LRLPIREREPAPLALILGVIGPMLLNIALHGMEEATGVRYLRCGPNGAHARADSPVLVRYADDLVAQCVTPENRPNRLGTGWDSG